MSSKLERKQAADQRRAEREQRQAESIERQRAANQQVYGGGALGQKAEDQLGAIYDLSTRDYKEDDNKQGTDERIQNDGIDSFGGDGSDDVVGYVKTSVILCVDGAPVTGSILFKAD